MIKQPAKYQYDIKEKSIEFSIKLLQYLKGIKQDLISAIVIRQLVRSGTSIGANIHEAQTSQSVKEMMKDYRIAVKSANESAYWLILLEKLVESEEKRAELCTELNSLRNVLGKTIIRLKEKMEKK